ncbi:MAG: hypothetical protein KC729_03460 [Candidatus Eisenbacteria bacterium]|uniref:Cytochrome c7-like domain-containing protein n=1 Tax=Eiseniibacteriota bacterium TaxID=2212470 RepID=A0A956LW68_UNCEI|nr:hypothetical protein [Candidatus Eisenbacteria bacterium]
MRRARVLLWGGALFALTAMGCADRRTPSESEISAHPAEWAQPTSMDFHGERVYERGPEACRTCHGADLHGDVDVASCYDCHDGAGGHPYGWVRPEEIPFHGNAFVSEGPAYCENCHGADSRGGWSGVSCYTCHAGGPSGHPDGWMNPSSASFHGRRASQQGFEDCRRCHGNDLEGGISGVACSDCHQ